MNITPKSNADVTNLGVLALAGAEAHGEDVRLRHNTALHIRGDLFALIGNPETPGVPGAQARLAAQLRLMRETYATLQTVLRAARTFCFTGIGLLRPRFGKRWNSDWQAAGFNGGSLAVSAVPLAMLTEFRRFLAGSPDAVAEYGFTAEDAQRHIDAIQAATLARANARGARWSIKRERDAVFQRLRKRLSNLRAELAVLLPPTDDRWYAFGFRRPADGQGPEPVRRLNVTLLSQEESLEENSVPESDSKSSSPSALHTAAASGEGESDVAAEDGLVPGVSERIRKGAVHVQWHHSARARSYRVSWRLGDAVSGLSERGEVPSDGPSPVPQRSLITADEQVTLLGIPINVPVVITVTARNETGESRPAEWRAVLSMP